MPKVPFFKDSGCCPKILDDPWPLKNIPKLFQGYTMEALERNQLKFKKR